MESFSFFVPGEPITEGSVRTFTSGQRTIVTHDRGRKLEWWRIRVAHAAKRAAKRAGWEPRHDGPVAVTATFLLPRPKSVPKTRIRPHVKPDLDKLARAIGDALAPYKRPGVLRDDSRIVEWHTSKQYACVPTMVGAIITVSTVDEAGTVAIYADAERIAAEELAIQEEAS